MTYRPRRSPRLPYTTLSRSLLERGEVHITQSAHAQIARSLLAVGAARRVLPVDVGMLGAGVRDQQRQVLTCQVPGNRARSEEHTSELQSRGHLVCRLLLEKKKSTTANGTHVSNA